MYCWYSSWVMSSMSAELVLVDDESSLRSSMLVILLLLLAGVVRGAALKRFVDGG